MIRSLLKLCLITSSLLLSSAQGAGNGGLTPEHILKQELLLNQLIVDIHLLQLDFLNDEAREQILDHLAILDKTIPALPRQSEDGETTNLLTSTLALWPVISRHAAWISKLPPQSPVPEATTLLLALAKLDRQLLLLRQKMLTSNPNKSQELNFLEQALLMQRLSREYLSLTVTSKEQEESTTGRTQLQTLALHFGQRLERMNRQFHKHPHAGRPIRQAHAAWRFIASNIETFPQRPVPEMVALYTDRIVSKLQSVHQMF